MFHKSTWFLCTLLLCFEQILSQVNHDGKELDTPPAEHEDNFASKPTISQQQQPERISAPKVLNHSDAEVAKNTLPNSKNSSTTQLSTSTKPAHTSPITSEPTTPSTSKTVSTSASTPTIHPPPAPTTPTPIPITPTPKPAQKGSWNVTTDKNITCLRIDGIFSIDYTYTLNKTVNKSAHYDVPKEAGSSGKCDKDTGEITLSWGKNSTIENRLTFTFKKNGTEYVLKSFQGSILNKTHFLTNNNETHFSTPVGQSYSCSSMRQIAVDQHTKVILDQFRLQAFKNSTGTDFDASKDCQDTPPHTADIVPIVVGCVLALLVIAVLVAYLISRRRSQTRGYLSM